MLRAVRVLALLLVGACGFTVAPDTTDAPKPPDVPVDTPLVVTWVVDPTSQKACPQNATEWADLITAYGLTIDVPNSVWRMQESSGPLLDSIGTAALAPFGGAVDYQQQVTGWQRTAMGTRETAGNGFANNMDSSLPDVSTGSMTILAVYATTSTPSALRTIMLAGANSPTTLAEVDIDPANHLRLKVDTNIVTGTVDHGTNPIALVLKLDRSRTEQKIITNRETITGMYKALGSSRGLSIGGAANQAANARWLYMAAWFGTKAEMSDAEVMALLTAMGW